MFGKKQKFIKEFKTKSGKTVSVKHVSEKDVGSVLEFNNRLTEEDTFLNMTGKPRTHEQEKRWLSNRLAQDKAGYSFSFWAFSDGRIVGNGGMMKGKMRSPHVGEIALMVDKDFRRDGVGQCLLDCVIEEARRMKIKILTLDVFSDNIPAIKLYEKNGFKEFGRLPDGLLRKDKYSDEIKMYKTI